MVCQECYEILIKLSEIRLLPVHNLSSPVTELYLFWSKKAVETTVIKSLLQVAVGTDLRRRQEVGCVLATLRET